MVVADCDKVDVKYEDPRDKLLDIILFLCFLSNARGCTTRTLGALVYPAPPFRFITDNTLPLPVSIVVSAVPPSHPPPWNNKIGGTS